MADTNTKDLQTQHDLQVQINSVLQARQGIFAAQQKALSSQVQLAVDMCKALKCEELDKVEERLKSTQAAMAAAATEAGKLKGSLDGAAAAGKKAGDETSSAGDKAKEAFSKSNLTLAGFGLGVMQFGGIFIQTFKNVISMAGGLLETLGRLGFAIFTLPFKLLGNLFDLAQGSGGGGPSPTAVALEKMRAELGGLNTVVGKSAQTVLPQFRAELRNMAKTGLSVRKVFGQGREGLAKAMEDTLELYKALGPAASSFAGILEKHAVKLSMYRKGLGLTHEAEGRIMRLAESSGKDPVKEMHKFATLSINMADQFGLSASDIGKDVAEMQADFGNFGTLSMRELAQTSVYARKLGIAVKELQGLIGAFDDFETAAQNAAKLSQAFNMNVDAMKMLNAENPAERLSMLQKAFRETGKSVEGLKRQELKLLAAQAGISDETARIAFSQKGLSMSYDQVQKAGAKAEKKQLTQAEAMEKLADAIERVFGSGGGNKFQGFFDAFSKGFQGGILRSKEVRGLFRDIRRSLRAMYWAGRAVGKMFVEMFPGVMTMITGLRDLFNPKKWSVLTYGVRFVFEKFFKDLQTDPKSGAEKFIKNMKELFTSFFGQKGGAIEMIVDGGKVFLKAIGGIFMAVAPMVLDAFVDAINAIADFLEKPPKIPQAVSALGDQLLDALTRVFDVLKQKLWPPVKRMLLALWTQVGDEIEKVAWRIFYVSIFKAFARGVVGALGGAAIALLQAKLLKVFKLAETVTPPAGTPTPSNPAALASKGPGLLKFLVVVAILLAAFVAVVKIYRANNLKPEDAVGIGLLLVALAGASVALSFALKLAPDDQARLVPKIMGIAALLGAMAIVVGIAAAAYTAIGITLDQAFGLSMIMLAMAAAGIGLAFALKLAPDEDFKKLASKAAGIGLVLLAMGAAAAGVMFIISKIKAPSTEQIAGWSAVMLVLMLTSLPLIGASVLIAKLPAGEAFKGLGVLALFMLAVGVLGRIIAGMLSSVPDPTGVGVLMAAISAIMLSTVMIIPAAIALGLLLGGPQIVVLAAAAGGMEALAGFALLMVNTLMPVINRLASIKITDPESFKAVTGALLGIMQGINEFVGGLTDLGAILKPSETNIDPKAFEKNIAAFGTLVNTILNSGINQILQKLMDFAQSANMAEGAADAIAAIADVFGAIAAFMKAFSPDGEILRSMAGNSNGSDAMMLMAGPLGLAAYGANLVIRANAQAQFLESLKTYQRVAGENFRTAMPVIVSGITTLLSSLGSIPASIKDVGPAVQALGSVLGAVAALMKAMSPSDAAMQAVKEAADTYGEDATEVMGEAFKKMKEISDGLPKMLTDIQEPLSLLVGAVAGSLTPLLDAAKGLDKDTLTAVMSSVSTVMSFAGSAMGMFTDMVNQAKLNAATANKGVAKRADMTDVGKELTKLMTAFGQMGTEMRKLGPAMGVLVNNIIAVARGVTDPKGLQTKINTISSAIKVVTTLAEVMKSVPGTIGGTGEYESGPKRLLIFMKRFTGNQDAAELFKKDGVIQEFVKLISGINILPGTATKAAGIKSAIETVSAVGSAFSASGGLRQLANAKDLGTTIADLRIRMGQLIGTNVFNEMKLLIDAVPGRVRNKSASIRSMLEQVATLTNGIKGLGSAEIAQVVDLGSALTGDGTLKVDVGQVHVTMKVTVNVDAKMIAEAILGINEDVKGPRNERFQTTGGAPPKG